jgi:hypothetical protein
LTMLVRRPAMPASVPAVGRGGGGREGYTGAGWRWVGSGSGVGEACWRHRRGAIERPSGVLVWRRCPRRLERRSADQFSGTRGGSSPQKNLAGQAAPARWEGPTGQSCPTAGGRPAARKSMVVSLSYRCGITVWRWRLAAEDAITTPRAQQPSRLARRRPARWIRSAQSSLSLTSAGAYGDCPPDRAAEQRTTSPRRTSSVPQLVCHSWVHRAPATN